MLRRHIKNTHRFMSEAVPTRLGCISDFPLLLGLPIPDSLMGARATQLDFGSWPERKNKGGGGKTREVKTCCTVGWGGGGPGKYDLLSVKLEVSNAGRLPDECEDGGDKDSGGIKAEGGKGKESENGLCWW